LFGRAINEQNKLISPSLAAVYRLVHDANPMRSLNMSKAKDTKKDTKKAATKTPKEKKAAKKLKKEERKRQ
jgi:mannose/fructose/N-acetylgalactosamine-specific phosphotransferase system component IIB